MKRISAIVVCLTALVFSPQTGSQGVESALHTADYYESDFAHVDAGDFPTDLIFKAGGMQIDTTQGNAMLRFSGGSWFHIPLQKTLPDAFTIEFDYYTNEDYAVLFVAPFDSGVSGKQPPSYSGYRQGEFNYFSLANTSVGVAIDTSSTNLPRANTRDSAFTEGVVPIRLEVKGTHARVFVSGRQVVMHPAAQILRTDTVEFFYASMGAPGHGYVGNIRIEEH